LATFLKENYLDDSKVEYKSFKRENISSEIEEL